MELNKIQRKYKKLLKFPKTEAKESFKALLTSLLPCADPKPQKKIDLEDTLIDQSLDRIITYSGQEESNLVFNKIGVHNSPSNSIPSARFINQSYQNPGWKSLFGKQCPGAGKVWNCTFKRLQLI